LFNPPAALSGQPPQGPPQLARSLPRRPPRWNRGLKKKTWPEIWGQKGSGSKRWKNMENENFTMVSMEMRISPKFNRWK